MVHNRYNIVWSVLILFPFLQTLVKIENSSSSAISLSKTCYAKVNMLEFDLYIQTYLPVPILLAIENNRAVRSHRSTHQLIII